MKNDREEELLFRGGEIADAILRFQKKNGNAYPTSLDQLVKGQVPAQALQGPDDRRTASGGSSTRARPVAPTGDSRRPGAPPTRARPRRTTHAHHHDRPAQPVSGSGVGGAPWAPILGVASTSTDKSLRVFNGRTQYNEWIFAAGQPRVIGRPPTIGAGGTGGGTGPGSGKPPSPMPSPPPPQ